MSSSKPKKVVQKNNEVAQLTDALQRERADATNIRRQHQEQIASLRMMVLAGVVKELLPVIDNLERSIKHVPKDLETHDYIKGINSVVGQFENTLQKIGVERIKTVGEVFDPELHEAVSAEEGNGVEIVSEELQSGYRAGKDVIRHAMVKVGKQ